MSRKRVRVAAGALLAVGALLSGCSSQDDAPAADPVEGSWLTAAEVLMTFADGDWEAVLPEGHGWDNVTGVPFDGGTYEVAGTTLTLTTTDEDGVVRTGMSCEVGQVAVYEMTVSDDSSTIGLKAVNDDCVRREDLDGRNLTKEVSS